MLLWADDQAVMTRVTPDFRLQHPPIRVDPTDRVAGGNRDGWVCDPAPEPDRNPQRDVAKLEEVPPVDESVPPDEVLDAPVPVSRRELVNVTRVKQLSGADAARPRPLAAADLPLRVGVVDKVAAQILAAGAQRDSTGESEPCARGKSPGRLGWPPEVVVLVHWIRELVRVRDPWRPEDGNWLTLLEEATTTHRERRRST